MMGFFGKTLLYVSAFALGVGICYSCCVNKNYRVIEENGRMYVEDKNTGRLNQVEGEFDLVRKRPVRKKLSSDEIGHDLKRRVTDAYDALIR